MKLLLFINIVLSLRILALDSDLITKIQLPIQEYKEDGLRIVSVRNDGAFIALLMGDQNFGSSSWMIAKLGFAVKNNGSYILFAPHVQKVLNYTNIISTQTESGVTSVIQDEINENNVVQNDGSLILKTIKPNGYLQCEFNYISKYIQRFKVANNNKQYISTIATNIYYSVITKFDSNGKTLSQLTINGKSSLANRFEEKDFQDLLKSNGDKRGLESQPNQQNIIFGELKDRFVYFYRLTDSDLLSSPNRITLGSSQNGSITATVNNPDQNYLNIQSSTNLIDWNTFKTIQNEPSLEIVFPANKPKEFIRAIE